MSNASDPGAMRLHVDSITGVPIELPIAGPGGRSYAFIIDWHIRALAAAAWGFGYTLVLSAANSGAESPPGWQAPLGWVPSLLIYLLYHPLLELTMSGRTPGKRIAGLRIVSIEGAVPAAGAIIVRNLFRIVDSLPILYVVGLAFSMATARHQRIGDLAAGTLLVYEDAGRAESLGTLPRAGAATGLSTADAELVQDLLDRWQHLDREHRLELARRLLARLDPATADGQAVWLNEATALNALRQWLGGMR